MDELMVHELDEQLQNQMFGAKEVEDENNNGPHFQFESTFNQSVSKTFDGLKIAIPIKKFTMSIRHLIVSLMSKEKSDAEERVFIIDREDIANKVDFFNFDFIIMKVRTVDTQHNGVPSRVFIFQNITQRFLQQSLYASELEKYNMR